MKQLVAAFDSLIDAYVNVKCGSIAQKVWRAVDFAGGQPDNHGIGNNEISVAALIGFWKVPTANSYTGCQIKESDKSATSLPGHTKYSAVVTAETVVCRPRLDFLRAW